MRLSRSLSLVAGSFLMAACADVVPPTGLQSVRSTAAIQGGETTKNPIYTGSLGEWNSVILRRSQDVPRGVNSSSLRFPCWRACNRRLG